MPKKISIKVIDQDVNILLNSSLGLQSISVDWAEMRETLQHEVTVV